MFWLAKVDGALQDRLIPCTTGFVGVVGHLLRSDPTSVGESMDQCCRDWLALSACLLWRGAAGSRFVDGLVPDDLNIYSDIL